MSENVNEYLSEVKKRINLNTNPDQIENELRQATVMIDVDNLPIDERVSIAKYALQCLSDDQRKQLAKHLILEQIVNQRRALSFWSTITAQSGMIDTGYISQHLVSFCTKIPGQGMRGKGLDLVDGSEVKSANFIDSKDKKGATEPRWNFQSNENNLNDFLNYKYIYLVSIDYSITKKIRIRIWKIDVRKHTALRKRYKEWMGNSARNSANFQLFPPKSETDSIDAHHGSNRKGQLPPTDIALENVPGAEKIFHAEVINDNVVISTFK